MASSNSPIHVDDGFNEYESAAKRQKSTTSKVWDEMTKLECENKNELKAHCNHFNKDISQYTIATQPSLRGVPFIKNYKFDADECRKAISTFLVCDKHSFRTVEEPGFRYMMSIASPNFKNISRYTAARDVLMYYTKERDRVKEELAKAPGLICLSSDNWNSEHTNDEYIFITAHWVDENWKLQKRIIRFRALFPPYDGLNIADELILFRCCAHILNLIVKAGLELADDVVGKIRNGIKYIKKLGTRRKRFYDVADKSFHLNMTKKLRQDVCVRWNSTYLMLESSLYYKDVHKVLLDTVKGPYSFLTPMVQQMEEKFNKYWAEYSLILSCAAILDPRYKLNYVQYCFTTIYGIHASDFVETILSNLRLLFDDVDFGGDFDESDDYKRYLNESSARSEKSQLDIYLEEPELELNSQIDVLDYWSKTSESAFSMGKKVITPLKSSLKPKTVQAVVCLDDWMRANGFSAEIGSKNDEDDVSLIGFYVTFLCNCWQFNLAYNLYFVIKLNMLIG
ncbi:hypothetical protein V6Z12_A02G171600 [Gossypium hirsutum]